jgi:hypothetical protein
MKNMLIAATVVGAAVAGVILYLQKQNKNRTMLEGGNIRRAARDAYDTVNAGIGSLERPGQHAMG